MRARLKKIVYTLYKSAVVEKKNMKEEKSARVGLCVCANNYHTISKLFTLHIT